jgi:hypothetical protein
VSLVTVIYLILVRHYGRYESIPTIGYHVFELNGPFGPPMSLFTVVVFCIPHNNCDISVSTNYVSNWFFFIQSVAIVIIFLYWLAIS